MATSPKKKTDAATETADHVVADVVDIDQLLIEDDATPPPPVILRFQGKDWRFKAISQAPLRLFNPDVGDLEQVFEFVTGMLCDGQPDFPQVSVTQAQALVAGYTQALQNTGGASLGESDASSPS